MPFLKKYTFRSIWIEIYLEGQIFFVSVAKKYSCLMMVVSNLVLVAHEFYLQFYSFSLFINEIFIECLL